MSNKLLYTIVFSVLAGIALYASLYSVQESQQVLVVRFGKVTSRPIAEPGLHIKVPFIDEVRVFEKRWLEWDGEASQITTLDKRYIYIDVFARWRISNPLLFIESLRDEQSAQGRLDDIIDNATRNVVANHDLIEVIRSSNRTLEEGDEEARLTGATDPVAMPNAPAPAAAPIADPNTVTDPAAAAVAPSKEASGSGYSPMTSAERRKDMYAIQVGREKLSQMILEKASSKAAQLGIELKDVQFKRINYIESVQAKVFDRMISERKRVAEAFRSQGRGRSAEILGQTDKELKTIQSEAYRLSQEIMGRGDAEAAAIYAKAYEKDPELYQFLKTLESYNKTIDSSSWLLFSTSSDYAKYLRTLRGAQ